MGGLAVFLLPLLALISCSSCFDDKEGQFLGRLVDLQNSFIRQESKRYEEFDNAVYKESCQNGDIALVIDSSSSITMKDFQKGKEFLRDFANLFSVGEDTVRFAAVTYGRGVYTEDAFGFEEYTNNEALSRALLGLTHHGGDWTGTGLGIRYMRENLMSSARTDVERIAIVITDGNSQEPEITEQEANLAKDEDITMFAIGVGSKVSKDELNRIASKPEYILMVDDYSSLNSFKQILDNLICKAIKIRQCGIGDISLVIDSSSSIWSEDYKQGLEFLSDFSDTFKIGPKNIRMSAVSYADVVYDEDAFEFDDYTTPESLTAAIEAMPHRAGHRTETGMAIKYMREKQMSQARPNVNRTAIVITDGRSQEPEKTAQEANKSKASKITMFAIGVGPDVSDEELLSIASKKDYVMRVEDYASLKKIRDRLDFAVCDEIGDEPCGLSSPSDIYFVYDGEYFGSEVVQDIDAFIRSSISQPDMGPGIQVGVISGLCDGMRGSPLRQYTQLADIKHSMDTHLQSDLSGLVRYLHTEAYTEDNGGRPFAKKVAVIFVDDKVSLVELQREADIAKAQGILVYVVGIGRQYNDLSELSSPPPEKYVLTGRSVDDIANTFVARLCKKK